MAFSCAACSVLSDSRTASPSHSKDRLGNDELQEDVGELPGEGLLARVRLRALPAVARAVIVHVSPFFQFAYKQAPAMAAADEPGVREIMLYLPRLLLDACSTPPPRLYWHLGGELLPLGGLASPLALL